jgi:hypothetical protein
VIVRIPEFVPGLGPVGVGFRCRPPLVDPFGAGHEWTGPNVEQRLVGWVESLAPRQRQSLGAFDDLTAARPEGHVHQLQRRQCERGVEDRRLLKSAGGDV